MLNENEKITREQKKIIFKERVKKYNTISYYLIGIYFGLSGITELAVSFFLKDEIKLEPSTMTQIMSLVLIPWIFKPFLGLISDLFPLFGYRRKYYLLISSIIIILSWLIMAAGVTKLYEIIILLFLINMGFSFSTVIGEAIVVELSQDSVKESSDEERDNSAKDNVSLFMLFKYSGYLASSYLKGFLVEIMSIHAVFLIAAFVPILLLISSFILIDKKVIKESKETSNNQNQENYNSVSSDGETVKVPDSGKLISEFCKFLCKKNVLVPTLFILFILSLPAYDGPYFYFLTNELKFSPTTLGKISFIATLATFISILLYKLYFKHTSFKRMITIGTLVMFLFTLFAYLLVLRVNVEIGISDFWLVMFSTSFINMLGELMLMPMLALAAKLCPKNLEGTVYSMFMSSINLGNILAGLSGSLLTDYLDITSTNFDNLGSLILISNNLTLIPLFIMPFISDSYFESNYKEEEKCQEVIKATNTKDENTDEKLMKDEETIKLLS